MKELSFSASLCGAGGEDGRGSAESVCRSVERRDCLRGEGTVTAYVRASRSTRGVSVESSARGLESLMIIWVVSTVELSAEGDMTVMELNSVGGRRGTQDGNAAQLHIVSPTLASL